MITYFLLYHVYTRIAYAGSWSMGVPIQVNQGAVTWTESRHLDRELPLVQLVAAPCPSGSSLGEVGWLIDTDISQKFIGDWDGTLNTGQIENTGYRICRTGGPSFPTEGQPIRSPNKVNELPEEWRIQNVGSTKRAETRHIGFPHCRKFGNLDTFLKKIWVFY